MKTWERYCRTKLEISHHFSNLSLCLYGCVLWPLVSRTSTLDQSETNYKSISWIIIHMNDAIKEWSQCNMQTKTNYTNHIAKYTGCYSLLLIGPILRLFVRRFLQTNRAWAHTQPHWQQRRIANCPKKHEKYQTLVNCSWICISLMN
jgi:hypothetical protein